MATAISALVAEVSKEAEAENEIKDRIVPRKKVWCIYYLLRFQKDSVNVEDLLHLGSKVNNMTLVFALRLDLRNCHSNVEAQKIDASIL